MGLDMYVFRGTPEAAKRTYEEYSEKMDSLHNEKVTTNERGVKFTEYVAKRGKRKEIDALYDAHWKDFHDREVWYWRKHPNLHGWMERLWKEKGLAEGKDGGVWGTAFNNEPLPLTEEDLLRLKEDIERDALPETSGFFFGYSDGSEKEDDLKFVEKALEIVRAGEPLYYNSSW